MKGEIKEKMDEEYQNSVVNPNSLKEAAQTLEEVRSAPPGYVRIDLSTRGLIGAPAHFYIRNFMPEDLAVLANAQENEMPIKIVEILDNMIWNPDPNNIISVKNFHEKEVVETLLDVYEIFYTTIFPGQTWIPTKEDLAYLAKQYGGENTDAYKTQIRALRDGTWKPTFDLDISKVEYWEIPDDIKTSVRVKKTIAGEPISLKFSLPKYGDFLTLKFFIDEVYAKEDARWRRIGEMIKFKEDAKKRLLNGENVALASVPDVPQSEYEGYKQYESDKVVFTMTATKALYIEEFNGQSLAGVPLAQKLEIARDPRITYTMFQQAQKMFDTLKFGYKEEVTVLDPIINKVVTRNYTFQLSDLLQAISDPGNIEADLSFE
jgi:hypothetical protein